MVGLESCSVTVATQEGRSAACASLTGRLTKGRTEGQTAGEKKKGRWLCVSVCEQETHHLQSPWHWGGGCSPGKRLAPRPPGAAPCDARSAPTAPSHRGALSGYLWWVGCWGLKGHLPGLLRAIITNWKAISCACKQTNLIARLKAFLSSASGVFNYARVYFNKDYTNYLPW